MGRGRRRDSWELEQFPILLRNAHFIAPLHTAGDTDCMIYPGEVFNFPWPCLYIVVTHSRDTVRNGEIIAISWVTIFVFD